ncbi:MAG: DNA endonuclease SmrA [Pseudomonadales bacterium]|jgi:DNA-nicking Smr family endonuclease|uniref:DNA endonuclease SmrA n=1 Tax=unclassified Ketobacter TaxID=2639109 RepID=UPI000C949F9C|nr:MULTISPECIES: DNA endonuclease SmrA [unclassified Ketobacter]MAQ24279.1 DNA endonuclease SmrA [Pseudomonadales bacterium]MEC8812029.1 DNA endonuclease SmrA [Pseudomonadota bacterium]TNC91095.1 MAG: DNA endonuclease SmrA [Alcanivorax sp.]HAG96681.1 DNA endonuclease SmrA [Gammaproteobacteria bacterium]RLT87514.1 MAG: DNA endonuclease SmrA [Ketobacter sp. GenoA1]|tara:strand:+ start:1532 stop:2113 length:582 start_codon:yes stop_codon:yes gene_type:complete
MFNPEDEDLFRKELEGVKPLVQNRVSIRNSAQGPSEAQLARREAAITDLKRDENLLTTEYVEMVDPHDIIEYKRPGVQEGVYRKLRLGKYSVDAVLDLHRKTVEQSRTEVFEFIQECTRMGLRTVMILHGKGDRSQPPALLKSYVNKWLPSLPVVMAFHSAQKHHGGAGALYVLLKKNAEKKQENRERHLRGR